MGILDWLEMFGNATGVVYLSYALGTGTAEEIGAKGLAWFGLVMNMLALILGIVYLSVT